MGGIPLPATAVWIVARIASRAAPVCLRVSPASAAAFSISSRLFMGTVNAITTR